MAVVCCRSGGEKCVLRLFWYNIAPIRFLMILKTKRVSNEKNTLCKKTCLSFRIRKEVWYGLIVVLPSSFSNHQNHFFNFADDFKKTKRYIYINTVNFFGEDERLFIFITFPSEKSVLKTCKTASFLSKIQLSEQSFLANLAVFFLFLFELSW